MFVPNGKASSSLIMRGRYSFVRGSFLDEGRFNVSPYSFSPRCEVLKILSSDFFPQPLTLNLLASIKADKTNAEALLVTDKNQFRCCEVLL